EGDAYAQRLKEAGGVVAWRRFDSLGHGFIHMTGIAPAACRALVEVARDWRALLGRAAHVEADAHARAEALQEEAAT
ncbi:MAG TPA: hypothetical protein VFZ44_13975, partial [Pyrinomonadaceae bacterium]